MNTEDAQAIIMTSNHWMVCTIPLRGARVLDLLNDGGSDFLDISDVKLYPNLDRGQRIAAFPEALIPKDQLSLVAIMSEKHEVRDLNRLQKIVDKKITHAVVVVSGYAIQGQMHLTTRADDRAYTFNTGLGRFFPITHATVHRSVGQPLVSQVVFVNKSQVASFYAGETAPQTDQKANTAVRETEASFEELMAAAQ